MALLCFACKLSSPCYPRTAAKSRRGRFDPVASGPGGQAGPRPL